MIEIICTTIGIAMLCLLGYKIGYVSGELSQIQKMIEKNETDAMVILIEDGSGMGDRRTDY